jgi:hypothetical protein
LICKHLGITPPSPGQPVFACVVKEGFHDWYDEDALQKPTASASPVDVGALTVEKAHEFAAVLSPAITGIPVKSIPDVPTAATLPAASSGVVGNVADLLTLEILPPIREEFIDRKRKVDTDGYMPLEDTDFTTDSTTVVAPQVTPKAATPTGEFDPNLTRQLFQNYERIGFFDGLLHGKRGGAVQGSTPPGFLRKAGDRLLHRVQQMLQYILKPLGTIQRAMDDVSPDDTDKYLETVRADMERQGMLAPENSRTIPVGDSSQREYWHFHATPEVKNVAGDFGVVKQVTTRPLSKNISNMDGQLGDSKFFTDPLGDVEVQVEESKDD